MKNSKTLSHDKQHARPSSESQRNASAPEFVSWCTAEHQILTKPRSCMSRKTETGIRCWAELLRSSRHWAEHALVLCPPALHCGKPTRVFFLQFDTARTTAAGICTFADFNGIWLQKQASMKRRCEIFIDIYKLEDNKKNFRPDTLWWSFLHWFGAVFPSELGKTKRVCLHVCVRATGNLPSLSTSINQKTMSPRRPTFLEKEFYAWYKLWKHYVTF